MNVASAAMVVTRAIARASDPKGRPSVPTTTFQNTPVCGTAPSSSERYGSRIGNSPSYASRTKVPYKPSSRPMLPAPKTFVWTRTPSGGSVVRKYQRGPTRTTARSTARHIPGACRRHHEGVAEAVAGVGLPSVVRVCVAFIEPGYRLVADTKNGTRWVTYA